MDTPPIKVFEAIPGVSKELNYAEILESCLVKASDKIDLPPICIEVIKDEDSSIVGTLGNISLIIGKAKQGKTFVISMALAAAESGMPLNEVLKVTLPTHQRKILHFDTEQSRYHVQRVIKRICLITKIKEPKNLEVYGLRSKSPSERLEMIEYAIYNIANIGLVVIDGIRDLVFDINSPEESTIIASKLLKWSEEKNIHIVTVLHTNKGDNNARGHLGSELTNKSETVLSVSKSSEAKDTSIIEAEYCRDKAFEPFAFFIDAEGLPNIIKDFTKTSTVTNVKRIIAPHDIVAETHKVLLKDIFSIQPEMLRSELRIVAKANLSRHLGREVGLNKTDDWITHWLQFNLVNTLGTRGTKACKYFITPIENNNSTKLT